MEEREFGPPWFVNRDVNLRPILAHYLRVQDRDVLCTGNNHHHLQNHPGNLDYQRLLEGIVRRYPMSDNRVMEQIAGHITRTKRRRFLRLDQDGTVTQLGEEEACKMTRETMELIYRNRSDL